MDSLVRYTWAGNVRQLESVARKIVELGDEQLASTGATVQSELAKPRTRALREAVRQVSQNVERELIVKALARTQWNQKRAARKLQIGYKSLHRKMKQLGLIGINDGTCL